MTVPAFDGPPGDEADPRALLLGCLDWYREALLRKVSGLSGDALRAPVPPMTWSPIGLVNHLAGVERRWLRWGFRAEDVVSWADDEWTPEAPPEQVLADYAAEVERCRAVLATASLADVSAVGGRFATAADAPPLARILFHLLQEYARHLGHLDVAREMIDGVTGE